MIFLRILPWDKPPFFTSIWIWEFFSKIILCKHPSKSPSWSSWYFFDVQTSLANPSRYSRLDWSDKALVREHASKTGGKFLVHPIGELYNSLLNVLTVERHPIYTYIYTYIIYNIIHVPWKICSFKSGNLMFFQCT